MAHYDGHVEAAQEAYVRKLEAENAQLKADLEQTKAREARLRSLLARSMDVLRWDGREDIAEELEEAGP